MGYQSGQLDQLITIQRESTVADAYGGRAVTLVTAGLAYAMIRPRSGIEREQFDQVVQYQMFSFVMRAETDVTETDTILWDGKQFNVRSIQDFPRSSWIEVIAEKGVAL